MEHITKPQIYDLLHRALIDLRAEGHTTENHLVFLLADLFHNVPLQLDRVDQGDLVPDEILTWLRRRSQGTLMGDWLTLRVPEVMARYAIRQAAQDSTPDQNEPH
jgi:hypothetical protein